ncbi:MAG: protein phosphatase 2C domain-containing protein [Desulfosporosinus sp.]|nr:protein phosphatase 2C domain-containing protein [Desulfosporosinus sp.]
MSAKHATAIGKGHRVNQDSYIVLERGRVHAYLVCDGHGDHGEKISRYVIARLPQMILSYMLDMSDTKPATVAIQHALADMDAQVGEDLREYSDSSGCTAAGVILDSETKSGYMFSVGDSLVTAFYDRDDRATSLQLQNASNAPPSIISKIDDAAWRTHKAYIGKPTEDTGTRYMLFPDDVYGGGLQLYSTLGDFDLKRVNPIVRVYPQVSRFWQTDRGGKLRFLVTSDGYLDGIRHKAQSRAWYTTIRTELEAARGDARDLVKMAKDRGSTDDITVLSFVM